MLKSFKDIGLFLVVLMALLFVSNEAKEAIGITEAQQYIALWDAKVYGTVQMVLGGVAGGFFMYVFAPYVCPNRRDRNISRRTI